ncbi:MAG: hypothetical protein JWO31_3757 [Phycisphaerales bacterium]|nr:hypothetical protein [Phycisphaerales bacterium]
MTRTSHRSPAARGPSAAAAWAASLLSAAVAVTGFAAGSASAQVKPEGKKPGYGNVGNVKKPEEKKPDPIVIKFQGTQKGKYQTQDVMIVTGVEVLSGKVRTFAVENVPPQEKGKIPKYDPMPRVKQGVDEVKPGDYLKVEPKAGRDMQVTWIDKAEPYKFTEHEDEPGVFMLSDSYKDSEAKDAYVIKLTKFGAYLDGHAPMVREGKETVPDPTIVGVVEKVKKKELVEATFTQSGGQTIFTSIDAYQTPKPGTFAKAAEVDVGGVKVPGVEIEAGGKTESLPLAGKLVGKKWVADSEVSAAAKRLKPGSAVTFKTRELDGQTYVRQIVVAPKEKETASAGGKKEAAGTKKDGGLEMTAPKGPAKK